MKYWDFYEKHLDRIITKLKEKAINVYDSEYSLISCQQRRSIMLDNVSQIGNNYQDGIYRRSPLNTHRVNSKARSIKELVKDEGIFANLHVQFSWLLHASFYNSETKLQQEFEEWKTLQRLTDCSDYDDVGALRELFNMIGRDKFRMISYHVIIGHQVIIRDNCMKRLNRIISSLSRLIPSLAASNIPLTLEYVETCKLQGLHISAHLPREAFSNDNILLVDILHSDINHFHAILQTRARTPEKLPTFLSKLEQILQDVTYSDKTLQAFLQSLKEEWLNKAKMVYAYTKGTVIHRSVEQVATVFKALQIDDCDIEMVYYWLNNGLSLHYKTETYLSNSTNVIDIETR